MPMTRIRDSIKETAIALTKREADEILKRHHAIIRRKVKLDADLKFFGATEETLRDAWTDKGGGINFFAREGEEYLHVKCLGGKFGGETVQRHYSPHANKFLYSPKYGLCLKNEKVEVRKNKLGEWEWLHYVKLCCIEKE